MKKTFWVALVLISICASAQAAMACCSFSTDFDGRGTGSGFSITPPSFGGGPSYSEPREPRDNGGGSYGTNRSDQQSMRDTWAEQVREAKRQARLEEIRRELERRRRENNVHEIQKLLDQLHELESDEPSITERMQIKLQIIELEQQFAQARQDYMSMLPSYESRLRWSIDHIEVPTPDHPKHYDSILFLGTMDSPEKATEYAAGKDNMDPFTGQRYDDAFAFGTDGLIDWRRSLFDHLLGQLNLLSAETRSHIGYLKGSEADEVVCHSNGCRVAEVLIATGELKVKKLRILGGDNVLLELGDIKKLQVEKGLEEVSVNITKGDIVPAVSLGVWKMVELIKRFGHPLESVAHMANDPTYQVLGLVPRPKYDPADPMQVHFLSLPGAASLDLFHHHIYENYSRIINGWRMSGCLKPGGQASKRCIIY